MAYIEEWGHIQYVKQFSKYYLFHEIHTELCIACSHLFTFILLKKLINWGLSYVRKEEGGCTAREEEGGGTAREEEVRGAAREEEIEGTARVEEGGATAREEEGVDIAIKEEGGGRLREE